MWLGAAGTGTAFGVLRSLREYFGDAVTVIAADIFPAHLVAASGLADVFEQVSPTADPSFTSMLLQRFATHGVNTYVPFLDDEILLAAQLTAAGRLGEITALAPSVEAAQICLDKQRTADWLNGHGLPTPRTERAQDATWQPEGVFVKPRCGRGSVGARLLSTVDELDALRRAGDDVVVQTRCRAPEVTIDAFRSRNGSIFRAVCRERLEVKAGVCTKARVFDDAELAELAKQVAGGLGLTGAFCMQVMQAWDRSEWMITDINPRPGAGTRLSVAAGIDPLAATFVDLWGGDPTPLLLPLPETCFVVRQYTEFVLSP